MEKFRREHKAQRDWGLEQRHQAKLRRTYGDNVPATEEEWLAARAARLAQLADAPEPAEPLVQVEEPVRVEEPVPAADACVAEPETTAPSRRCVGVRVGRVRRVRGGVARLEGHRDVRSADGNYRIGVGATVIWLRFVGCGP
ncbi:hypothetical protein [Dactylosporangium sp. NPDC051541]|uniref:hypothetical protein n=1 Tax=Dactylosporangium sp. NPDC051541 TaxID=3363977 RepID=UPI00379F12A5